MVSIIFFNKLIKYKFLEYQQWIFILLRNHQTFTFKRLWTAASWNYSKFHVLIEQNKKNFVFSWLPYCSDVLNKDEAQLVLEFISTLNCTYLCGSSYCSADTKGIGVIRPFLKNGVLRDLLHKVLLFFPKLN